MLSRVGAETFWCDKCNVPLLTRFCGTCKGEGRRLKLSPPADARPALGVDYVQLWRLIEEELNGVQPYPRRRIVLLNKIPYPDSADEVIIDGYIIGHRYFDLEERKWRFKPLYAGVSELVRSRVGYYAIVDLSALARNYEVHKDRLVEASLPPRKGRRFIALATPTGIEGVGVLTEKGRIKVLKSWRAKKFSWNNANPTWLDAMRANESRLALLEQEAVEFLQNVAGKTGLKPVVSFSGGKDSLVTYRLAEKAFGKLPLLFNDTGLELPETVNYVKRFAKERGLELILAEAGQVFWSSLEAMGPPARDYRWCCKVCKLVPTARVFRERAGGGILSIVGQRKLESAARALSSRVYRNKWIPQVLVVAPIHNWSALDVWLYIFKEKLPVNALYFKGFDRLGCWLCPAIELGEVEFLKALKPELWDKWKNLLSDYARLHGYGGEWVELGLWRWVNPPGDIRRYLKGEQRGWRGAPASIVVTGSELAVSIKKQGLSVDTLTLLSLLSTVGNALCDGERLSLEGTPIEVRYDDAYLEVRVKGGFSNLRAALAIVRAVLCLGCGSCELWCPTGAIRVEKGKPKVDLSKCTRCGSCSTACPLSEYLLHLLRPKPVRGS